MSARRGVAIAEMIVAFTLSAIVSAAAVASLASAEKYMTRARATADARRTLREAAAVLASELRAASADSIRLRGDTAIDFLGLVGVSVVCVSSASQLVLPPDIASSGLPFTAWRAVADTGDIIAAFDTTAGGAWRTAIVSDVSTLTTGAGCTPATGLLSAADSAARRPVTRLQLRSAFGVALQPGTPVRLLRGGRYALTKSGDGSWSLSYRRCAGSNCGAAQPVVGPLATPPDSGLRFTSVAAESRVEAALRAPPLAANAPRESAVLRVTIRNRAIGNP